MIFFRFLFLQLRWLLYWPSDVSVLRALMEGPASAPRLGLRLGCQPDRVFVVLCRLKERGLVRSDSRLLVAELTAKGFLRVKGGK